MKVLLGNVKTIAKDLKDGETVWIADVVGIGRGVKTGMSNFGDWTAIMGNFVARPLVGENFGKQYRTGQLFLPDVANNLVIPVIEGNKGDVQFAFKIGITQDDDAAPGYIYTAEYLMEPEENDPLEMLIKSAMPALPAPKPEENKTVEKTT